MKKIVTQLEDFTLSYPLERYAPLENIFFIDIETTGFTAKGSSLYLIGGAFYKDQKWNIIQWLAENYSEEKEIMNAFKDFAFAYSYFIHFNGNNFDIPYLSSKARMLNLDFSFLEQSGLDLYRRITPYKSFLKLENCKQKTIEQYLGLNRTDTYGGGELISMYHDYVSNPTDFSLKTLLLHNSDDMHGMLQILPMLSYFDLFNQDITATKVQANAYTNYSGQKRKELYIQFTPENPLVKNVSLYVDHCYFSYKDRVATLRIPILESELKYFYSNYTDYYYLQEEDTAIHKAVATYVDPSRRTKAKASTCYTKHTSAFIPQWDFIKEPFFKTDYKSKDLYFELTEDVKKDRELFHKYAKHVLNHMLLEGRRSD